MSINNRQQQNTLVHQVARPRGEPLAEHFRFVQQPPEQPGEQEAWVENIYFSVDPYMRECMDGDWPLNAPLEGRTIGRVINSEIPELQPGDLVFHRKGWRTHALVSADEVRILPRISGVPVQAWLSILGGTGLTAWVALTQIARLQPGESVYISAAAGGVGSAAAQFASLLGAGHIAGSTSNAAKAGVLTERLGYTHAFVYQSGKISEQLRETLPSGIDVFLDNVGGEQLEAAIDAFKPHGRAALIGAVAQYSALTPPSAPHNLFAAVDKSLILQGFLVRDYTHLQDELEQFAIPHIQSGRIIVQDTVTSGFDRIVEAFLSMLKGGNTGKAIVSTENT